MERVITVIYQLWIGITLFLIAMTLIDIRDKKPITNSNINIQPYVVLQTEEPISKRDTLQVLSVEHDTIFIGCLEK